MTGRKGTIFQEGFCVVMKCWQLVLRRASGNRYCFVLEGCNYDLQQINYFKILIVSGSINRTRFRQVFVI